MAIDSHVGETGVYSAIDLIPQASNPDGGATSGNGTLYVNNADGTLHYKKPDGTDQLVDSQASTVSANQVLAGPASGSAVAPSFRALGAGDVPAACFRVASGVAGHNGAGALTVAGAKVGDKVLMASYTGATPPTSDPLSALEASVTVAGQVQQSDAANLSAGHFSILLLALS